MKKITLILLIAFPTCIAQSIIEGFVLDKNANIALPYAAIKLNNSNSYLITNINGKFSLNSKTEIDSLEVMFLGYKSKKIHISDLLKNNRIYLTPNIFDLDEIVINANKDEKYLYNLIKSLIEKYRNLKTITNSKAYITTSSSTNNIPIEHIEGFYNAKHSLYEGLINLELKSGRFGQNKSLSFYSLDNSEILKYFSLFKIDDQILPIHPGNIKLRAIKRKYNFKIDFCENCDKNDILVSFTPKKNNLNSFSGSFYFNKDDLVLKKIELNINNPKVPAILGLVEDDIIELKKIELKILFNPLDFNTVQYIDYNLIVNYKTDFINEQIKTGSFIYFFDYNKTFESPYFVNKIQFNNDYDKMLVLKATTDFWENNYQFPQSDSEKKSLNYIKKFGYLINYENSIPLEYITLVNPSVITWDREKRITWNVIKESLNHPIYKNQKDLLVEKYNFNYVIDQQIGKDGVKHYINSTIFDRNNSFCMEDIRDVNKLLYINLKFDIYEFHRQKVNSEIIKSMSFKEVKKIFSEAFKEASSEVSIMAEETKNGENFINLIFWNKKIKERLKVDNYKILIISNNL